MKTEEEKEAIIEKLGELFKNDIVDRYDVAYAITAAIPMLVLLITQAHPGDRRAQLHMANELARFVREEIERGGPDALPLQ